MSQKTKSPPQFRKYLKDSLLSLFLGVVIFLGVSILFTAGIQAVYAGRILPGVHVLNHDIGGMTTNEALTLLNQRIDYPQSAKIILQYQASSWEVTPFQLGVTFNVAETIHQAYLVGRTGPIDRWLGDWLTAFNGMRQVLPVMNFDQEVGRLFLSNLAVQIDQPTLEASLEVQGADIIAHPGQIGVQVDIPATLNLITSGLQTMQDGDIPILTTESIPKIIDASQYAQQARTLLNTPLILTVPTDPRSERSSWEIPVNDLASMLVFEVVQQGDTLAYQIKLDEGLLRNFLAEISAQVNLAVENPRFIFNDDTRQLDFLQAGLSGRALKIEQSIATIQEQISQANHTISLDLDMISPEVSDSATAAELGITELVHAETSYFYGSSSPRVQNIQVAAARFHGLLVPPGATFSMVEAMGEISLDTGYTEALIIFNGRTIEGIGGGVCQVSTTLFRTAFNSGFPILERTPHAYRVSYYEKISGNRTDSRLAGMDATVFAPLVDLKFINDTPFWLLMETYVPPQNSTIIWKFYSTSDGRTVDMQTTGPINLVEPPKPIYKLNPELPTGKIKQVDWEAQGADVVVNRSLYRQGTLLFQDRFETHYEPWGAVYEYGPNTPGIPEQEIP